MRLTAATTLLALLPTALSASLTIYLPAVPNPFSLPPTTHATLTSLAKHHSAPLSAVNTFVFHNVTADSYLVDVHCPTDGYHAVRVDVGADGSVQAWETYRGNDWANKGEALAIREGSFGKGFEVRALGSKIYFMERPQFSVFSILKNPMILMGGVSMLLFFGMPYLMDNMDPEMRAEFEEQQKKGPMAALGGGQQAQNPLGNFDMAAYLAGSNKKEGSGTASPGGGKNQGGGGVRR